MPNAHYRLTRRSLYRRLEVPTRVRELIRTLIDAHGLTDEVRYQYVKLAWREIVGVRFAASSWPDELTSGTLRVKTTSSAWSHEGHLAKAMLMKRINTAIAEWPGGPPLVTDLRFTLGTTAERAARDKELAEIAERHTRPEPEPGREPPPYVSEAEKAAILAQTASIEDPETRAALDAFRLTWGM